MMAPQTPLFTLTTTFTPHHHLTQPQKSPLKPLNILLSPIFRLADPITSPSPTSTNPPPQTLYNNLLTPHPSPSAPKLAHHSRLPIIGYLLDNLFDSYHGPTVRNRYGPIYTTTFLRPFEKILVLASRHHVLTVLREMKGEVFKAEGAYPKAMDEMLGNDVLTRDGGRHAWGKGLTRSFFKREVLEGGAFEGIQELFAGAWRRFERTDELSGVANDDFEYESILDCMGETTFRIILGMTLGWNEVGDEGNGLDVEYIRGLFDRLGRALFAPKLPFGIGAYHEGIRARDELLGFIGKVVDKRLKSHGDVIRKVSEIIRKDDGNEADNVRECVAFVNGLMYEGKVDLVSLLIAMHGDINDLGGDREGLRVVCQAVLGFWFAGSETTSALITSAVHELGRRPLVLKRLIKEQDDKIAMHKTAGNENLFDELDSMPILDSFFNEMSRLRAPSSALFRRVAQDAAIDGYEVKKGSLVYLDLKAAVRDEDLFPDPSNFDIDRYLTSNTTSEQEVSLRKQCSMLAFGGGPHFCTGAMLAKLEFKTAISILLRKYELKVDPKASLEYSAMALFRPKSETPIRLALKV